MENEEIKINCFECGVDIKVSDWIKNPIDTYGCSRHL